jgi:hypothetical protein
VLTANPKARQVLVEAFWSAGGWRRKDPRADDFALAKAAGYMFDPIELDHDDLVARIVRLGSSLHPLDVSNAFLASLTTRRLELRPALSSFAVGRRFPVHSFAPSERDPRCKVCEVRERETIDRNVLNFERHKWGGVRFLNTAFVWFALDRFVEEGGADPTEDDLQTMATVLAELAAVAPETTSTMAERALRCVKSSKGERYAILDILGVCGVMEPEGHPSFALRFLTPAEREMPNLRFMDRTYPVVWWRGSDGINQQHLRTFFPQLSQ